MGLSAPPPGFKVDESSTGAVYNFKYEINIYICIMFHFFNSCHNDKMTNRKRKNISNSMITNFIFYNTRVKADIFIVEEKTIVIMKKTTYEKFIKIQNFNVLM